MKLHIGAGARIIPGWVNIDAEPPAEMRCDVRKGLPFGDGSVTHIYSEHFVEHLTRDEGQELLQQCFRVLVPGGVIRISTPCLRRLLRAYMNEDLRFAEAVGWLPTSLARMVNGGMRDWGHQFIYDQGELLCALKDAGFTEGMRMPYQHSGFAEMVLENRPNLGDLIVEAVRP